MPFDPVEHLTDLKGKKYLECRWRLMWFRDDHPQGKVNTEMISAEPLIFRASVLTSDGELLATGHGSATAKPGAVWSGREVEKAETAAISRALGHAGYGTQFTEDDELMHLADSPVTLKQPQQRPTPASQPAQTSTTEQASGASNEPDKFAEAFPEQPLPPIDMTPDGLHPQIGKLDMSKLWRLTAVNERPHFDALIKKLWNERAIRADFSQQGVLNAIASYYLAKGDKAS